MSNKPDMVSHPPHYQSEAGLEVIDVIRAFTADLVGIEATDTGNIIKYICRWKHKNGLEDLKKARWYLDHLIGIVDEEMEEQNMATEDWKPNITVERTKPCEYEGESMRPYGDALCNNMLISSLVCTGRKNCDKYTPVTD